MCQLVAGMSPHSGVSQVPRALPVGLHNRKRLKIQGCGERRRSMAKDLKRTPLNSWHREHGGQMIEFAGWEMPVAYPQGILEEHLKTRKFGGLFDISHMGRFLMRGVDGVLF